MRAKTSARESRNGWGRKVRTTLTVRDLDILYALGLCGILRTRDIRRLFFGSQGTANDRLNKLKSGGFTDAHVRALDMDNHYTLTDKSRDLVAEHFGLDPGAIKVVKNLPVKLDHLLAITDVRVHLALACRTGGYGLQSFETDADLAVARHAQLLDLIPDAKVVLRSRATGDVMTFVLEVDLGTESVTYLVRRKFAVYARHAALSHALYGVVDPLIVMVTTSLRRARNVARALAAERVDARVVFALAPVLDERTVLTEAYALPADLVAAAPDVAAADVFRRRLLP